MEPFTWNYKDKGRADCLPASDGADWYLAEETLTPAGFHRLSAITCSYNDKPLEGNIRLYVKVALISFKTLIPG